MLRLSAKLRADLFKESLLADPKEACGFLLGHDNLILDILPSQNDLSEDRFCLTAVELTAAENAAAPKHQKVLGFYHSHPQGQARPSDQDHDEALPGYIYAIIGLKEPSSALTLAFFGLEETTGRLIPVEYEV
jgi:proteasome lid subunit RPN8/RPN11